MSSKAGRRRGRRRDDPMAAYGRIDILINNQPGLSWGGPPGTMALDKWQKVLDTNLTGAFLFSQAAGREMLKREHGCIINIASVAGLQGAVNGPHYAGYAASKAGLMGLTRELAASWGRQGIRVNAIAPGFFHSRLKARSGHSPRRTQHPRPSAPSPASAALATQRRGRFSRGGRVKLSITGQVIVVDGGRTTA